jgi:hypothetical protein
MAKMCFFGGSIRLFIKFPLWQRENVPLFLCLKEKVWHSRQDFLFSEYIIYNDIPNNRKEDGYGLSFVPLDVQFSLLIFKGFVLTELSPSALRRRGGGMLPPHVEGRQASA